MHARDSRQWKVNYQATGAIKERFSIKSEQNLMEANSIYFGLGGLVIGVAGTALILWLKKPEPIVQQEEAIKDVIEISAGPRAGWSRDNRVREHRQRTKQIINNFNLQRRRRSQAKSMHRVF